MIDDLIDVVVGNRVYLRCLYCYNKCDLVSIEDCDRNAHLPDTVVARSGSLLWINNTSNYIHTFTRTPTLTLTHTHTFTYSFTHSFIHIHTYLILFLSFFFRLSIRLSWKLFPYIFPSLPSLIYSCELGLNFEFLLYKIWEYLDLIRVYTKKRGGEKG